MKTRLTTALFASLLIGYYLSVTIAFADDLHAGAGSADITPTKPATLDGQMKLRIATEADTPITANVIVLESRNGDRSTDAAVMVSCDLSGISDLLANKVRAMTHRRLPAFDLEKMFLNATHTHTAPIAALGSYQIPSEGVMQVEEYCDFAAERIADAIEKAWKNRTPSSFTWGIGSAAVAENRRAVYADGHAEMYGTTDRPDFRGLEGYVDHSVGSLFFWNKEGKLIAVAINVACPSQEVEGQGRFNADFWHPVRERLRKRFGADLCVLGWPGAAGDISPHEMLGKGPAHVPMAPGDDRLLDGPAERMRRLRKLSRLDDIAAKIEAAVRDTYETVKNERQFEVKLSHRVATMDLPNRLVTDAEYAEVKATVAKDNPTQLMARWQMGIIKRYESQKDNPRPTSSERIHVLRIGDVAICTNSFELFTDYGIQIKARSRAEQTFVIQLTDGGPIGYLPTERAIRGGGYSAVVQSNIVGAEGGQMLVDQTIATIDSLWPKTDKK